MSDELYPEHAKLGAVAAKSQACGDFLSWLREYGYTLCETHKHDAECAPKGIKICGLHQRELIPTTRGLTSLLAEFFGIDETKLAAEKDAMLKALRERQKP